MIKLTNFTPIIKFQNVDFKQQNKVFNTPTKDCFIKSSAISFTGEDFDIEEFDDLISSAQEMELKATKEAEPHYRQAYNEVVDAIVNNRPIDANYILNQTDLFSLLNSCTASLGDSLMIQDRTDESIALAKNTINLINEHYHTEVDEGISAEASDNLEKYQGVFDDDDDNVSQVTRTETDDECGEPQDLFNKISEEFTVTEPDDEEDKIEDKFAEKNKRFLKVTNTKLAPLERYKELEQLEKDGEYAVLHHVAMSNTDELSNKLSIVSLGYHKKDSFARSLLKSISERHPDDKYKKQAASYLIEEEKR